MMPATLQNLLQGPQPILALAPMQDITDLPFLRLMQRYGGADLYFTEYFRVYPGSHLNRNILRSVLENPTGRPVIAQLIGSDAAELARAARELQQYPVAGIDLNLGCPAPVVYRKWAGGGLLRDPDRVNRILSELRQAIHVPFSVKTRLGFQHREEFDRLLEVFVRHPIDLLTVHGRTVSEQYRSAVHYQAIARAAAAMPCPVLANGNVSSRQRAQQILTETGARGLMVGRGAIRNPWLFEQIRLCGRGEVVDLPTGRAVLAYVRDLLETLRPDSASEKGLVARVKKHLNFLGLGVDPDGGFLHRMRRATSEQELLQICRDWLDHDQPMTLEPYDLGLSHRDVLAGEHC